MEGPFDHAAVDVSHMDWVTAFRSEVVDARSGRPLGHEFFCHSQLQLENTTRLMVAATGSEEIRFPQGFAMPVSSIVGALPADRRGVGFVGMVLNNHIQPIDELAVVRATIEYWRNEDLQSPPRKLFKVGLPVGAEDAVHYTPPANGTAGDDPAAHCSLVQDRNTHWLVPPGELRTETRYSGVVPVDATVHYAVVHLHNYGVWLRLTDKTTGQVLWQTDVAYEPDRVQIKKIPVYSSTEGFPLYKDHEYEVAALYRNTTDREVDAMALLDLYYNPQGNVDITYPDGPG